MHGSRRVLIVVAVLALTTLTACGTTVRVNGAQVDSKVPFITVLEQAWRDGPATEKYAQPAQQTSCWLLRDPDSGALQPRALCGPIRHLRDLGKPGVFDELEFEPRLVGKDEVAVDPDSIEFGATGVEPPEDFELYHPDGTEPVAPDQVPEPSAPKAEAGLVAQGDDAQIAAAGSPKDGVIRVPGHKVSVTRFGAVPRLPAEGEVPFYVPADNEEFLAVTVTIEPQEYDRGSVDTTAAYAIRSQGKTTDLAPFFELKGDWGTQRADTKTIVVSVPKGQDAELVVGVAGLDQTISMRTGERTSTVAAADYRSRTTFGVNQQFATQKVKEGDFAYQHGVTFTEARVAAFDPSQGWAPAGQMWLYLAWDNKTAQRSGDDDYYFEDPTFDQDKSMQLADGDGKPVKIISGIPVTESSWSSSSAVLAQVPETTKAIKVTYAPSGTFAANSYGAETKDLSPKSGSFAFEPLVFDVDLS